MERRTIAVETPLQALVVEQALAMAKELEQQADAAPDGQVLDVAEKLVLQRGQDLMRTTLQAALQAQAAQVEKKGRWFVPVAAVNGATTRDERRAR